MKSRQVPIIRVHDPLFAAADVSLYIQRLDLVHPTISGNKWYKLKYNLQQAKKEGHHTLLTFGGAYSNHIYATAAAGEAFDFKTIGIIRGEETKPLNYTLRSAQSYGMQLHYIDRESYRHKDDSAFITQLRKQFGRFYLLPEGGTNLLAVKGCTDIIHNIADFDYVCISVGTGGTLAGLAIAMEEQGSLLGFSALKNGSSFLSEDINKLTQQYCGKVFGNFQIIDHYHFGGYAKFKPELIHFINRFTTLHQIPLDPIYTGKMLFGIYDMIKKGLFSKGSRILAIHSGGLQGVYGFNEQYGSKKFPLLKPI